MTCPDIQSWLHEAKAAPDAAKCGMYLVHNGVVRESARAAVRSGAEDTEPVTGMDFSYDAAKVGAAAERARALPGIYYIRVWLNSGRLLPGDDLMLVLVGGDIRPRVIAALESLVEELKTSCVTERELFRD